MNKKRVAKLLHKKLNEAIKSLPDIEYGEVDLFTETTYRGERDHTGDIGLHNIELSVWEAR